MEAIDDLCLQCRIAIADDEEPKEIIENGQRELHFTQSLCLPHCDSELGGELNCGSGGPPLVLLSVANVARPRESVLECPTSGEIGYEISRSHGRPKYRNTDRW
jgi:hypothetical protein